ncbi:MAG: hypothetical protein HY985_11520 [Magnetospirillum sp.]|nr:hypothetical protein [Magnetospirillum sp.]
MSDERFVFDEKSRSVRDMKTGALLGLCSRLGEPQLGVLYKFVMDGVEVLFYVKSIEEKRERVSNVTGQSHAFFVPVSFSVESRAVQKFVQAYFSTHATPPERDDVQSFVDMVSSGILLLATYGGKHPEICEAERVHFDESRRD